MDHNHMPGTPTQMQMNDTSSDHHSSMMMLTRMTFYWGKDSAILFSGWPGTRLGMYILALICVFLLAVLLEWISHCKWIKNDDSTCKKPSAAAIGMITIWYGVKMALSYLVMLSVMSFNVGVLIVTVAGHVVGFLLFGCNKTLSSSANVIPTSCI